jgi:hypothetical protein
MEPPSDVKPVSRLYAHTASEEFLDQWSQVVPFNGGWVRSGSQRVVEVPASDWLIAKPETELKPWFNSYSGGTPRIPEGLRETSQQEYEQVRQGQLPEVARVAGADTQTGPDRGQPYTPPQFIR